MKFLFLLWAGVWRKPARTVLTALSIVVAFALFGFLRGVDSAFRFAVEQSRLDRMFVDPRFPGTPLPRNYRERIRSAPGVELLTEVSPMFGSYRDPQNGVLVINTTPDVWLAVWSEWQYSNEELQYVMRNRPAVMVSEMLAKAQGLKIGDQITVQTRVMKKDGNADWTFEVGGILHNPDQADARNYFLLANWDYFDEARTAGTGMVARFLMRIEDPTRTAQVAREIDAMFTNSPAPTKTQSEQSVVESRLTDIGDVNFFTRAIIGAVFFALLLLTANTIMQSVRERTTEFGVLGSLGFPARYVFTLVIVEALLLYLTSAVMGLVVAAVIFPVFGNYLVISTYDVSTLSVPVVLLGLLYAAVAAIVSASIPAWQAQRLGTAAALAGR